MTVIDLTPIAERLGAGLKHGPEPSDWDPEQVLWSFDGWSMFGAVDGWLWATDMSTGLIEKSIDIPDMEHDAARGRRVIELCNVPAPGPFVKVALRYLAIVGGAARVPSIGDFDLNRLWDAALWISGSPTNDEADDRLNDSVLISIEQLTREDQPRQQAHLYSDRAPDRRAVVMGTVFTGDWFPTIDIPFEIVDQHPDLAEHGSDPPGAT